MSQQSQDDDVRQRLVEVIEKITGGTRDPDELRRMMPKARPDDPFLLSPYRTVRAFLSEDLMWWDDPIEQRPLLLELALLKSTDISSDRLIDAREKVWKQ